MRLSLFSTVLILFMSVLNAFAQQYNDLTKYQDTAFIKYNKDKTGNSLRYGIDTIIFESDLRRHILTGTTVLPFTQNQQGAIGFGLHFIKVGKSDCQIDAIDYAIMHGGVANNHINSIIDTDSTLIIDFNMFDNCCYSFLCDISIEKSEIVNLIYYGYGTYCECDCCWGLTYYLKKDKNTDLNKIKSVMINGDIKTIEKIK